MSYPNVHTPKMGPPGEGIICILRGPQRGQHFDVLPIVEKAAMKQVLKTKQQWRGSCMYLCKFLVAEKHAQS